VAAKRFFRSAKAVTGVIPDRVTTDGHDAYPRGSGWNSVAPCGIGQTPTSTIASSRIIVASRADVDRCSASRASHQPDDIAAVTTNSGTSSALVLACANTFPPLRGAFTTCAGQPSLSVCWKLLEPGAPQLGNLLLRTGSKADRTIANCLIAEHEAADQEHLSQIS
jgi:hypothetical protein